MKKVDVQYTDEEMQVTLHLRQASGQDGIRWKAFQAYAMEMIQQLSLDFENPTQRMEYTYRLWNYPTCMASLESADGAEINQEMNYDQWIALPYALLELWYEAAVEVNPNFSPFFERRRKATTEPSAG